MNIEQYYLEYSDKLYLKRKIENFIFTVISSPNNAEVEALYSKLQSGILNTEDDLYEMIAKQHKGESLIDYFHFLITECK